MTHEEYRRGRPAEDGAEQETAGGIGLSGVGTATGGGLVRAGHPGPGRRRLRRAELAARTGDPLVSEGLLPSYRCFPSARKGGQPAAADHASAEAARTARPGAGRTCGLSKSGFCGMSGS
ncbi:hypothetical protein GCM10010345_49720 [Streptomyces canarius]|uniref:Uncharacterized protein n=1 Tax=Streptomyces canarius TaxID=285453 RepID=A0ABQ3CVU0_9ACTN|nr:hypothetical protein GCM10010345_49720 [Streptomyces canarius]